MEPVGLRLRLESMRRKVLRPRLPSILEVTLPPNDMFVRESLGCIGCIMGEDLLQTLLHRYGVRTAVRVCFLTKKMDIH